MHGVVHHILQLRCSCCLLQCTGASCGLAMASAPPAIGAPPGCTAAARSADVLTGSTFHIRRPLGSIPASIHVVDRLMHRSLRKILLRRRTSWAGVRGGLLWRQARHKPRSEHCKGYVMLESDMAVLAGIRVRLGCAGIKGKSHNIEGLARPHSALLVQHGRAWDGYGLFSTTQAHHCDASIPRALEPLPDAFGCALCHRHRPAVDSSSPASSVELCVQRRRAKRCACSAKATACSW